MAKIRSVKPEFFSSEQVVSVSIPARYLFEGIWVFGDDEGLIKYSSKSLKMKVFPGDDVSVEPLLDELIEQRLVIVVPSDQGQLLWAPNVQVHQSPKNPILTKFTGIGDPFEPHYYLDSKGKVTSIKAVRGTPNPLDAPFDPPGEERRGEERKGEKSGIADAIRPEVEQLLALLDQKLRDNDVRRLPTRNKSNVGAMRLLIDKDGYEPAEIADVITWCQKDSFWRSNVMSPAKLRDKYETLRLQMRRQSEGAEQPPKVDPASLRDQRPAWMGEE